MDELRYLIGKLDEHYQSILAKTKTIDFESQKSDLELEYMYSSFFGDIAKILDYIAVDIFEKNYVSIQDSSMNKKIESERRSIYFPIKDSEKDFNSVSVVKKIKAIDKNIYMWLKSKQPFSDKTNNIMSYVKKLNNDQKHRKLQVSSINKSVPIPHLRIQGPNVNIQFNNVTFDGPKGMKIISTDSGEIPIEHLFNVDYYLVFNGVSHMPASKLIDLSLEKIKEIAFEYLDLLENKNK